MPSQRKLDLRINELSAKGKWLTPLSALLRDAKVLGDGRWDVRRMCYEIDFERLGYESRVSAGDAFEYPSITCRLSVMPVLGCVDGRDAFEGRWQGERVQAVELQDYLELAIFTTYGTTSLNLSRGACLEIRDLGPPTSSHTVCDYGDPAIDLRRAGELLRARVV